MPLPCSERALGIWAEDLKIELARVKQDAALWIEVLEVRQAGRCAYMQAREGHVGVVTKRDTAIACVPSGDPSDQESHFLGLFVLWQNVATTCPARCSTNAHSRSLCPVSGNPDKPCRSASFSSSKPQSFETRCTCVHCDASPPMRVATSVIPSPYASASAAHRQWTVRYQIMLPRACLIGYSRSRTLLKFFGAARATRARGPCPAESGSDI